MQKLETAGCTRPVVGLVLPGALTFNPDGSAIYFSIAAVFIAAAFFSFHLLFAYLADLISIHVAFALAAATSLALTISYLRIVFGARFAFLAAGGAQLVTLTAFLPSSSRA
jgi:Na+/H+-dicarboxylate symporter